MPLFTVPLGGLITLPIENLCFDNSAPGCCINFTSLFGYFLHEKAHTNDERTIFID